MTADYEFEVPCQRDACQGVVKGKTSVEPRDHNETTRYDYDADTATCTVCGDEYEARFTVTRKEENDEGE